MGASFIHSLHGDALQFLDSGLHQAAIDADQGSF